MLLYLIYILFNFFINNVDFNNINWITYNGMELYDDFIFEI